VLACYSASLHKSDEETQSILDDFHRVQNPRLMTENYFDLVAEKYDALYGAATE